MSRIYVRCRAIVINRVFTSECYVSAKKQQMRRKSEETAGDSKASTRWAIYTFVVQYIVFFDGVLLKSVMRAKKIFIMIKYRA